MAAAYRFTRGQIEVVVHRSDVTNLIASVPTGQRGPGCGTTPTPATSCQIQEYRNIGKANIQGVEVSGNYPLNETWRLNGSLEYLNARDGNTDARLADRPTWVSKLAAQWRQGSWQFDIRLRHTRDWYAADPALVSGVPFNSNYTVAALRLAYAIDPKNEINFGVDNLANRAVPVNQTSRGTPDDPGARFFYAGYSARF